MLRIHTLLVVGGWWSLGVAELAVKTRNRAPSATSLSPPAPTTLLPLSRRQNTNPSDICGVADALTFACSPGSCYQYVVGQDDRYFGCCQGDGSKCQITTGCVPATAAPASLGYYVLTCSGVSSECATYTWPAINVKAFTCDTASRSNIVTIPGPVTVNPAIVMTAPTGFGIGEGGGPGSATSGVSSTQAESAAPTGPDGGQAQPAIYHGLSPLQNALIAIGVFLFVLLILLILKLCSSKRPKWFRKRVNKQKAVLPFQAPDPLSSGDTTPQSNDEPVQQIRETGNKTDMTPGGVSENEKIDSSSVGETSGTGQSTLTCSVKGEE